MASQYELRRLLASPNETLAVEHKSWLNVCGTPGGATLANAAIALANHGGGIIVLGMCGDNGSGGTLGSQPRPAELAQYS